MDATGSVSADPGRSSFSPTSEGLPRAGTYQGDYRYGLAGSGPRQLAQVFDPHSREEHTFEHDMAGRLVRTDSSSLTFDGLDQLLLVEQNNDSGLAEVVVEHAHGHDQQRVRTVSNDGTTHYWFGPSLAERSGQREHYLYLGDRLIARMAYPSNEEAAPNEPTGAVTTYFHSGPAAGPFLFTDQQGRIAAERRYTPFGHEIDSLQETGPGANVTIGEVNYDFMDWNILNKQTDPDTGFSYHGARWVDPDVAMWLSADPALRAPDPKIMEMPWRL